MLLTEQKKHTMLLRLANKLGKDHETVELRIFLMADTASCAVSLRPPGPLTIKLKRAT